MEDITKRHYEDRETIDRYVDVWWDYRGYGDDYKKFASLLPKGALVLDAGCGPGREVKRFIRMGLRAIGVDYSKAMIQKAKEMVPEGEFHLMSMKRLKFGRDHFDGLWTSGTLVHFTDDELDQILSEFRRVLKPNGILFICTRVGKGSGIESGLEGGSFYINYFEKEKFLRSLEKKGIGIISAEVTRDDSGRRFDWITVFARVAK